MHDWEQIRSEHGPAVWSTVSRILRNRDDALDCYQEVFLECFQKATGASVTNLPGLLRWLAVRRALDVLRFQKRHQLPREAGGASSEPPASTGAPADPVELAELMERVRHELNEIPSNQARAFWLCCVEQSSYAEAAEQMQIDRQHIGVLVHRARAALKRALSDIRAAEPS